MLVRNAGIVLCAQRLCHDAFAVACSTPQQNGTHPRPLQGGEPKKVPSAGNVYLNPLDHFIKRKLRCKGYVRYVDDLLLFADDKATLWRWKQALIERAARFRLCFHDGAHPRPVTEGIPFLGFIVFPEKRRLKRRKGVHFRRKYRRLLRQQREGRLPVSQVTASVRGWANHVRYANTVGLRKKALSRLAK